jgi:proline iminopeptidase
MKVLYPPIAPFKTFHLAVTEGHSIYVEQSGNVNGIPVLFLHGGPCSGTRPSHRQFFNPDFFHIILFDQRGCGQSKPFGRIDGNTTADLIADLEAIRQHLSIDKWVLFGGSWGAALALLYAQQYQQRVEALVLRGVFLARRQDMDWFITNGANKIYPELFEDLLATLPKHAVNERVESLYKTVFGADKNAAIKAAKAWEAWGSQLALGPDYSADDEGGNEESVDAEKLVAQVKMELHYAKNNYFIEDNQILNQCGTLTGIPVVIIHGRQDLVCPLEAGWQLAHALPQADFNVLPTAGHIAQGEAMVDALVTAMDDLKKRTS